MLHVIRNTAFGEDHQPLDIAVLGDGSVLVQTDDYGLYRIVNGRIHELWAPNPRCGRNGHFEFAFAQPLWNAIAMTVHGNSTVGVRGDGSLAFQLTATFES
ncbi:MAG TPA: hypothetical protein VEW74_07755, partial [Candidatus Nitrosotalea sp.]|nr:hypothetical protein [Candidatus Nitrosotalea sp.]